MCYDAGDFGVLYVVTIEKSHPEDGRYTLYYTGDDSIFEGMEGSLKCFSCLSDLHDFVRWNMLKFEGGDHLGRFDISRPVNHIVNIWCLDCTDKRKCKKCFPNGADFMLDFHPEKGIV